jgi:phosphatidylglycerophosphate synthase
MLTVFRLALGVVSALAFAAKHYPTALALFVLSAFIASLGGYVAKRQGRVSALGAFLDAACDWVVILAWFTAIFRATGPTTLWFHFFMLALSLRVITHLGSFFVQGGFAADKQSLRVPVSSTGTISTVLAYGAGVLGGLDALFPGLLWRRLGLDTSVVLLFASMLSTLFAVLFLLVIFRSPPRQDQSGQLPFQVHPPEPLFRLLLERLHLRPLEVGLCFEVFLTVPLFLTALSFSLFFENTEFKGIFRIYSQFFGYAVILPLISWFAAKFYASAPSAIATLTANRPIDDAAYKQFLALYNGRAYVVLTAAVTVIFEVWFRLDMVRNHVHTFIRDGRLSVVECVETLVHLISVYLVLCVLAYGTAALVLLTRLLNKTDFDFQLFHEDRYVGIREVVHLLTVFGNIVLLVLVEFALTIIDAIRLHLPTVTMHLVVFVFGMVALPVLTFAPIWVVHRRLIRAREAWMARLNVWFRTNCAREAEGETMTHGSAVPHALASFAKANELKRAIDAIPMWPLPAAKVVAFVAKLAFTLMAFAASVQEIRH